MRPAALRALGHTLYDKGDRRVCDRRPAEHAGFSNVVNGLRLPLQTDEPKKLRITEGLCS